LTVGIGSTPAFEFTFPEDLHREGAKSSSGFLKLLVAIEYVNLEWIEQKSSPFDSSFMSPRAPGLSRTVERMPEVTWDALTVTLTMVK
jgi:hypothetical protein